MDASVMEGGSLGCGAVSGLGLTRNPICAARFVMESTPHVFFQGECSIIHHRVHVRRLLLCPLAFSRVPH